MFGLDLKNSHIIKKTQKTVHAILKTSQFTVLFI